MAPGASSAAVASGIAILSGIFLGSVCLVVIPSLISTFTSDGSSTSFGSEYAFDAIMLKFMYYNQTSGAFVNGTVSYSADLSRLCTAQYTSLGATNFLGCILYNGKVFAPYNESTNSRRRRQTTKSGMYYVSEGRVYFSDVCVGKAQQNKTDNSTGLSNCVKKRLTTCNSIINRIAGVLTVWTSSTSAIISATNSSGTSSDAQITAIYGVPSNIAVALAQSLGLPPGTIASLQTACRYVGQKSTSTITSNMASITSG